MYGIFDRYIGKNMLLAVSLIAISLTVFTTIITLIDKMRYIGRGSIDFFFVCEYVLLLTPGIFVTFFPVAVLIGGVIAMGSMSKSSELVVLQSLGLSKLRIALSALKSLFPAIIVVLLVGEFLAPPMEQYAENRYAVLSSKGQLSVTKSGVWLKEGQSFIGIHLTMVDGSIRDVLRYDYDGVKLKRKSHAKTGFYRDGIWVMGEVSCWDYYADRVEVSYDSTQNWELNLNPERMDVIGNSGNYLTVKGLLDYISYLDENGQDSDRYRLELYSKFMQPFIMVVMLFLALSTVFGSMRNLTMSTRLLTGIAMGFGYYVVNQVLVPFSLVYGIPPSLGASLATLLFGGLAVYLLSRKV